MELMTGNLRNITLVLLILAVSFPALAGEGDSAVVLKPQISKYDYDAMPKDPLASAFFSATFPGSGQIYNKEYLRGIITGAGFYASLLLTYKMIDRWEAVNTDTFYIEEVNPETGVGKKIFHKVTASKTEDEMAGLPTAEKVILGTAVAGVVGFWLWAVIDGYRGAKRYNKKLFANHENKVNVDVSFLPVQDKIKLTANYRF
jgi:TM2 domain-containing membrane protein YozV